MKSLVHYINESKNDIISLLNNFKVDFSDVSSMPIHTVDQRYEKGKAQEKIFIDTMNNGALPEGYTLMSIEDWCEENGQTYSPKIDSKLGDIVINDGKEDWFIDLKVSLNIQKTEYVGTPTILSLVNFSGQKNHIYFLSNVNGSIKYVVDADKLMKLMTSKSTSAYLMTTKHRSDKNSVYPEVRNMEGKINIKVPKSIESDDPIWSTDYIDNEDFVSSFTIKNNYNSIKA